MRSWILKQCSWRQSSRSTSSTYFSEFAHEQTWWETMCSLIFRKTQIAKCASARKRQELLTEETPKAEKYFVQKIFGHYSGS